MKKLDFDLKIDHEKLLFSKSSGNRFSRTFQVFYDGRRYHLRFLRFERTDPLISEKEKGIKPKRYLVGKKEYYFDNLRNIDFDKLPFKDLTQYFDIEAAIENTQT
ncbi:hypothetical protein [Xenorhabdus cabanillasii]|uniref:Uncharacterized protein n=1 Tax=Xenorhabdus cabanillasii JM26 TaxID=1427517 RepID=W1J9F2_9GAMM|nr:hypothetical protein [Xenorhabdus cabanillasii]PHM75506.1 hypothetical protein Xcab_04014 [Xenorhabdus cabanillasii JM26]CDL86643.1 hypothetical protein XCR1_4290001 [Xenorhabdus cabanillasii JM26]